MVTLKRVVDAISQTNFKSIGDALQQFTKRWFYRATPITVTLAIGNNDVRHGLGRVPTIIIPSWQDAASSFYYAQHSDALNFVVINSSAVCKVTFYVD